MDYKIVKIRNENDIYKICLEFSSSMYKSFEENKIDVKEYSQKIYKSGQIYIAYEGKELMGMICFYCNNHTEKEAYLSIIAIKEPYRGKGIGSLLLHIFEAECNLHDIDFIRLEVDISNKRAMEFYKNQGYSVKERTSNNTFFLLKKCSIHNF